ncbi:MAG TPA: CsbD family protein [Pyrinomonadaceae bacterium]|nr:CsbD family protein [Pyrinomonadaceae bacterium]
MSANSASAKNRAAAAISKEATSKAKDNSGFIGLLRGGGRLPPFRFSVYQLALGPNRITTAAFVARVLVLMKSSTKDKIKGGFREAKGKVKEKAGKATGNPDLHDRGTIEKAGGKVQRKIGDVKKVFEQ